MSRSLRTAHFDVPMLIAPSYQGQYYALATSALFILLTIGTETLRPVLPSVRYSTAVMML